MERRINRSGPDLRPGLGGEDVRAPAPGPADGHSAVLAHVVSQAKGELGGRGAGEGKTTTAVALLIVSDAVYKLKLNQY